MWRPVVTGLGVRLEIPRPRTDQLRVLQSDARFIVLMCGRRWGKTRLGGALCVALRIAERLKDATIVTIVCDRGDRYLSTGLFPD
mgnify:CR=1 FL=1